MTRQYLRSATIDFEGGNDGLRFAVKDGSELRFKFQVEHGDKMSPNRAAITVYNVAKATEQRFLKEFKKVSISAGYRDNVGLIFKGEIIQRQPARRRRSTPSLLHWLPTATPPTTMASSTRRSPPATHTGIR